MKVKINDLNLELQTRAGMNHETVQEYAEWMKEGKEFPPVKVFRESKDAFPLYLADGFHRVYAAVEIGLDEIEAEIDYGTRGAALAHALKANAKHGLQRTRADKQHALEMAWENRETLFPEPKGTGENGKPNGLPSSRQLAAVCYVSQPTAADFVKNKGGDKFITPSKKDSETARKVKQNLKAGKDCYGEVIPEGLLPIFQSGIIGGMIKELRKIRRELHTQLTQKNLAFAEIGQNGLIDLDNMINRFDFDMPYCVCLACHGNGCDCCKKRGFLTKGLYKRQLKEYKHPEDRQ